MTKILRNVGLLSLVVAIGLLMQAVAPAQACAAKATTAVKEVAIGGFDVSVIKDNWCGDFSDGTIRMVRAWQYERQLVEDETGDVWYLEEPAVQADDFLLMWIADNHTPNDTMDDIIVKVWREAY